MLTKLLLKLFSLSIKNQYYNKFSFVWEYLAVFFSLLIYWYTAKAFTPAVGSELSRYGGNYFTYIVIGEAFLSIPFFLFFGIITKMKRAIYDGTFETFLSLPVDMKKVITLITLMDIPREVIRLFITILFAILIFGMKIPISLFFQVLLLQLMALPIFVGAGLLAASIVLILGRGETLIGQLNTVLAFLAGAFFPLEVFPKWVGTYSVLLSPFSLMLKLTRDIFANQITFESLIFFLCWLPLLPLGWYLFEFSLRLTKKRGDQLIFTA